MAGFFIMRFREMRGHWPLMNPKPSHEGNDRVSDDRGGSEEQSEARTLEKNTDVATTKTVTASS